MEKIINITLDGPGGSGKTTMAKKLAEHYGIAYLDTGAMYRGIACYVRDKKNAFEDTDNIKKLLPKINMEIKLDADTQRVYVNNKDYTPKLRDHEISNGASIVSAIPEVRLKMVELQRDIASKTSVVADGRDMGSYVLPDAEFKFYLNADVDTRAKRRYLELKAKNMEVSLDKVKADMIERDERDSKRAFAPLVVPKGAYVIDTTNLAIDEVMEILINKIEDK